MDGRCWRQVVHEGKQLGKRMDCKRSLSFQSSCLLVPLLLYYHDRLPTPLHPASRLVPRHSAAIRSISLSPCIRCFTSRFLFSFLYSRSVRSSHSTLTSFLVIEFYMIGRNLSRTDMARVDTKNNMIRYIKIPFVGIS